MLILNCQTNYQQLIKVVNTSNIAYILQGEFPDKNTQEDGYVGVAPVNAFPAQNKFGKRQSRMKFVVYSIKT